MTTDLFYLTLSAILCICLWMPYIIGSVLNRGFLKAEDYQVAGIPKSENEPAWLARANRAHINLVENLPGFIALVLVAHLTSQADNITATAAMVFFWARLLHAIVYITAIPYLRTLCFSIAVFAQLAIAIRILT